MAHIRSSQDALQSTYGEKLEVQEIAASTVDGRE